MWKVQTFVVLAVISNTLAHPATEEGHITPGIIEEREVRKGIQLKHEIDIQKTKAYPTVKCEAIVPSSGEPGPENHEACLGHCVAVSKEYIHGQCLRGICHCRKEVVEKTREIGIPTVQCEHIVPVHGKAGPHNHEACKAHCGLLEYKHGECVESVCHCQEHHARETEEVKCEALPNGHFNLKACSAHCRALNPAHEGNCFEGICRCGPSERKLGHPTLKCEHLIPLKGKPSSENHDLCFGHCKSLSDEYIHGECSRGICHCQLGRGAERDLVNGHPTVKCEHIHPLQGLAGPENHEACLAHCHNLGANYASGRCARGICHCKVGNVEKKVTEVVEHAVVEERLKCEELVGSSGKEGHEACLTHCLALKKSFSAGICKEGLCHCH